MTWLPDHDDMLRRLHPMPELTQSDIARAINAAYDTEYTFKHISKRSALLGLPKRGRPYEPRIRVSERVWQ